MHSGALTAFKTVIIAAVLLFTVAYHVSRFSTTKNGLDFPAFYCAAKMVLAGSGSQLYDIPAQQRFQMKYTGRVGVIFNYPPCYALLYLPSALLPYDRGYLLWTVISTLLLALCAVILNRDAHVFRDSGLLVMLVFLFAPVALNFLQGHALSVLLLVYTLVYKALHRNRLFEAGAVLAAGLFKPHLVLPCFLVLLIALRSWKFLAGFTAVAAVLGTVSLAISGWHALLSYPSFVVNLSHIRLAGYSPGIMANCRGLLSLLLRSSGVRTGLLSVASAALLWAAISAWKNTPWEAPGTESSEGALPNQASAGAGSEQSSFDLAFANSIVVTLLVGYHLSPQDLTLLLLPMALAFRYLRKAGLGRDPVKILLAIVLAALFLPPLHVIGMIHHNYAWLAVPMLMLSVSLWLEVRRSGLQSANGFPAVAHTSPAE